MKAIYTLVGMKYAKSQDFVPTLPAGEPITLRRQPDNPADQNAVQAWARGRLLGYVKGTQAFAVAKAMDAAKQTERAGKLSITPDRWPMIEVDE